MYGDIYVNDIHRGLRHDHEGNSKGNEGIETRGSINLLKEPGC